MLQIRYGNLKTDFFYRQFNELFFLQMVLWMVFPYIIAGLGVMFYVTHFPEIHSCSGTFDIYGSSHQIWHVLIFSGMASWYWLSCWVSTTRPETCVLTPVGQGTNITIPEQLINASFLQYWL